MTASRYVRVLVAVLVLTTLVSSGAVAQEGTEIAVRNSASAREANPSQTDGYLAWHQSTDNHPNRVHVFVKPDGAKKFKVGGNGDETGMGSLDGDRLVYQQFDRNSSSIRVMNLTTRNTHKMKGVNTRRWEYLPRADGNWVMFGRIVGDNRKLILVDTSTGSNRVLDKVGINAYLLPGQVNGDFAVWNVMRRGKAKVKQHQISTNRTTKLPTGDRYNWGPSVTEQGTTYFGRSNKLCGGNAGLFRMELGGTPTEIAAFPAGTDMATSSVYETPEGKIEVFHDRAACSDGSVSDTDIFKVIDPLTVTLTTAVTGQGNATGTVTGSGIDCGADCTQDFEPGTQVTLTATPAEGDTFDSWSEASCGAALTCTITITADMTVTANFRP